MFKLLVYILTMKKQMYYKICEEQYLMACNFNSMSSICEIKN